MTDENKTQLKSNWEKKRIVVPKDLSSKKKKKSTHTYIHSLECNFNIINDSTNALTSNDDEMEERIDQQQI